MTVRTILLRNAGLSTMEKEGSIKAGRAILHET